MQGDSICYNGEIVGGSESKLDIDTLLGSNFVYQRIHTLAHTALHIETVIEIANNSYKALYGYDFAPNAQLCARLSENITQLLEKNRYPKNSNLVTLYLLPPIADQPLSYILSITKQLLYKGYATWHSRVTTIVLPYEYPFPSHKTAVSLSANSFAQVYARTKNADAAIAENYDKVATGVGEDPLFAIEGQQVITTPIACGATDSIERRLGIKAAESAGLEVLEEPIYTEEIGGFDELFIVTGQGVESIKTCEQKLYPNIIASKIGTAMSGLTHCNLARTNLRSTDKSAIE